MSGSCTDRSATSYAATTAATIGAAEASDGNDSHCRGPSTRWTDAPATLIKGRARQIPPCRPAAPGCGHYGGPTLTEALIAPGTAGGTAVSAR